MNQALYERIMVEEDGTVVGQLAGPYWQLHDLTLVIPATQQQNLSDVEESALPQQEALFGPKSRSLGVPAWMYGQYAWEQRHSQKPRHPAMSGAPHAGPAGILLWPGV